MQISEIARAKINLCLHVVGQKTDGYHVLDSIVSFADYGDQISVVPSDEFTLKIDGPFAKGLSNGLDNLVLRAARTFTPHCVGADITLTKNLPVGSGIGGGSADAAATLRALSKMTGAPLPADTGLSLGADVPICVQSVSCRMQGIGEKITPLTDFPRFHAVLVCPQFGVSTAQVFEALTSKDNTEIILPGDGADYIDFLTGQRNDLQVPAQNLVATIDQCLERLNKSGAFLARMSGSGATCFGLFESLERAQESEGMISHEYPNWWVQRCVLGD